jgi:aspartyl-tRNA(Asn)/glutamyl-tRNA(Gln) amidotransferase subunit A
MEQKIELSWKNRDLKQKLEKSYALINKHDKNIFTQLFTEPKFDKQALQEGPQKILANALISIKDLIDVEGYKTKAGSVFLATSEPAEIDAEPVKRLREAGAHLLGHTNMTELAYSGLGVNPHYGTPKSPLYPDCIAGGSTSGGAVSVALGIADVALGSDTGGSLRIPAAFCGITGFKPSQQSVSRKGCLPLSDSLDSIGPIAKSVAECEVVWKVLSGSASYNAKAKDAHFIVPKNFGLDSLDDPVRKGFNAFLALLKTHSNIIVEEKVIPFLDDYKTLPIWQFSAFEAQQYYQDRYADVLDKLDPRIASRLYKANTINKEIIEATRVKRQILIERYKQEEGNAVLLLPTVAILPPKLSDLESDENYDRINSLCLRNTSLANVLDGCSFSLPFKHQSDHIGVMLIGANKEDNYLISVAKLVENIIRGIR